jgi:hypothetical protein
MWKGRAKGVGVFSFEKVKGIAKNLGEYKVAFLPLLGWGAKGKGKKSVQNYKQRHFASYRDLQTYKPFFLTIMVYISIYNIINRERRGQSG